MKHPWVFLLAPSDEAALAPLRLAAGLEIAPGNQALWLRGPAPDEALARALSALPATARFERLANDRLRPLDSRIASQRLPDLRWTPLAKWCQVALPPAALAGTPPGPVPLRLVRSTEEQPPNLLLVDLETWTNFALRAAEVRLRPLRFAVSAERRVLVRGLPLPPLPGGRFVERGNVAVPAGFAWQPAVPVEVVRRLFAASGDALVLWQADGSCVRLHSDHFIPATRGAARETLAGFSGAT
jgi:hypothetical protein